MLPKLQYEFSFIIFGFQKSIYLIDLFGVQSRKNDWSIIIFVNLFYPHVIYKDKKKVLHSHSYS